MKFCNDYPYIPPHVQFSTRIFHPNVFPDGTICPEILQNDWTPAIQVKSILNSIKNMLCNPDLKYVANPEANDLFMNNVKKYKEKVAICVEESWIDDDKSKIVSKL